MSYAITLGALRCLSARVVQPAIGVWYVDLVVDPDDVSSVPLAGAQVVTIAKPGAPSTTLTGTIDPKYSGTYVANGKVRVLAGAGGWDNLLPPEEWSSQGGVLSAAVLQQTGGAVGETVNVPSSTNLGPHYERIAGPARRVFGDSPWYVDLTGVTQFGTRPSPATPSGLELLFWDPGTQRAVLTADALITPGLVLSDPRLNGASPVVRDVIHTFDAQGDRAEVWCAAAAVSRLPNVLQALVREFAGVAHLREYRYRYVQPSATGGLTLQAVSAGVPDIQDIAQGTGMAGVVAKLGPGTIVYVRFVNGDPTDPIVTGYDSSTPALEVDIAGGDDFVVPATHYGLFLAAIVAFAGNLSAATTLAQVIAAGTTLNTALGAILAPTATRRTKAG